MPWVPDSPTDATTASIPPPSKLGRWVPDAPVAAKSAAAPTSALSRMMAETLPKSSEEQFTMETAKDNAFNAPGQYAGQKTQAYLAPKIGEEPAKLVAAGVAGALSPAPEVGLAARAGYGLASQAAEDIAGRYTNNPYAKTAAGFLPAVASHFAEPVSRAIVGKGEIEQAGQAAADKTVKQNTAEQTKLEGAAATEAEKQKAKAAGAAESAGQKNLAERETAHRQAQEQVVTEQQRVAAQAEESRKALAIKQQEAQAKASQTVAQAREKLSKDIEPEARAEAIQSTVVPPSGKATMDLSPERIARGEEFRDKTIAPLQRWRQDWADRRDAVLAPIAETRTDAPELLQSMNDVREAAGKGGIISGKIKSLYKRAHLVTGYPEGMEIFGGELTDEDLAGMPPDKRAFYQQMRTGIRGQQPKVSDLLALQSDASAVARSSKGIERRQAMQIVRGVDDTLTEIDPAKLAEGQTNSPIVAKLGSLNAEYRDHRAHFPYAFEDAVQGAPRPVDAAKQIFGQEERVRDLMKLGNSEEQQHLRTLFTDYMGDAGEKVITPGTLTALGYTGPLTKPEVQMQFKATSDKLGDLFDSAPAAKAKFMASVQDAAQSAQDDLYRTAIKDALKETKKLGAIGTRIEGRINAANSLADKYNVVQDTFNNLRTPTPQTEPGATSPQAQQAVTQAGQGQVSPGGAAFGASIAAPRDARQALANFKPNDPNAAAIQAIQTYKPPQSGFMPRLKYYAQRNAAIAPILAAGGRTYPLVAAASAGGIVGAHELISGIYRNSLAHPERATAVWRAFNNPGVKSNLDLIGKLAVAAQIDKMNQPEPEKAPSESKSGFIGGIASKRAENIAGPKATDTKIDTIKDIDSEVRAGKVPDVHKDLGSGRISTSNVRQMLDGGKANIASVFEGLTPEQSIDALAKASPQEKSWALPIVAQQIADSGKTMPKPQQQALLARLKQVISMEESEG